MTGGTGFIGMHTLAPLLEAGYEVELVVNTPRRAPPGVSVHTADLFEPGVPEALVARVAPTHLLHMAWFMQPGQVWNSPQNLRWTETSLALMRGFADVDGQRAVVAGSCSEYAPGDEPCREGITPTEPTTLYGLSKNALWRLSEAWATERGFSLAWARIFLSFGPHEHPARLVASVTRNLLRGQPAPCSHGRQVRDFLYTPDIGRALVALLGSDVTGPVNIASGRSVCLRSVIEYLGASIGRPELIRFGEVTPPKGEPPVLKADVTRAREEVGWAPAHTLEDGLDQTIEWWRANT